jgi:hypothetical protein
VLLLLGLVVLLLLIGGAVQGKATANLARLDVNALNAALKKDAPDPPPFDPGG